MGLYAAVDFKAGERLTVYTGRSLGKERSESANDALAELKRQGKAGHVMTMGGELIDGREAKTAAQYINANIGSTHYETSDDGKRAWKVAVPKVAANAKMDRTGRSGTISVVDGGVGSEVLMVPLGRTAY